VAPATPATVAFLVAVVTALEDFCDLHISLLLLPGNLSSRELLFSRMGTPLLKKTIGVVSRLAINSRPGELASLVM
jgi:hypothetical protein